MAKKPEGRELARMGKIFPIAQIKTFDLQMIMIIIASSWSRDQSMDQGP
jgi:hypothetical protein